MGLALRDEQRLFLPSSSFLVGLVGISKLIVGVLTILPLTGVSGRAAKLSFLPTPIGLVFGAAFNNAAAYDFAAGPASPPFTGDPGPSIFPRTPLSPFGALGVSFLSGRSFIYRRSYKSSSKTSLPTEH
jgi:hypothetical protein